MTTNSAGAILDSFLSEAQPANTAAKVTKDNYSMLVALNNVSSYSMQQVYQACPRKWQIKKMQAATGTSDRTNSVTFAFGHAVGAGVAEYDKTGSIDAAILEAFFAWDIDLLEIETKGSYADGTGKPTGKSFAGAALALHKYATFVEEETQLREYEVVNIEATIAIDFEDGHYYVGHIDELLRSTVTGKYLVKENKTTGLRSVDPVMYSNSDQALSYAVVVDMLGGTNYEVMYTVYSSSAQSWSQFGFVKSALKKAEWLQDQILQNQHIDMYSELDFFPKRGASCYNFMRRCEYYDKCDVSPTTVFGLKFSDILKLESRQQLEEIEHIDYFTTLSEITARQQAKISGK